MLKVARATRDSLERSVKLNIEPWTGLLQDTIRIRRTESGEIQIFSKALNRLEEFYYWETVERGFREPHFIPFTYPDGVPTAFGRWVRDKGIAVPTGYRNRKGYEYYEFNDGTVATGIRFMYTGRRPFTEGFEEIYSKLPEILARELERDFSLTFNNRERWIE